MQWRVTVAEKGVSQITVQTVQNKPLGPSRGTGQPRKMLLNEPVITQTLKSPGPGENPKR